MKRKGLLLFLSSLFLAVLLNTSISQATSFYVYDDYDTWSDWWSDANKTSASDNDYSDDIDDDYMCWAAAASNILYWSGWANVDGYTFSSSQDIFEYFQKNWTNEGSSVYYALEWWFEGTSGNYYSNYENQIKTIDGGDFWTADYFGSSVVMTTIYGHDISNLSYLLGDGYGVSLTLTGLTTYHAITCWGYRTDESGRIIGIYVTDSDDDYDDESNGMQYYELTSSTSLPGAWYLSNYFGGSYYISEVFGLQMSTSSAVPEPATALLFGLGIMGLAGVSRKGQNVTAFPNG